MVRTLAVPGVPSSKLPRGKTPFQAQTVSPLAVELNQATQSL